MTTHDNTRQHMTTTHLVIKRYADTGLRQALIQLETAGSKHSALDRQACLLISTHDTSTPWLFESRKCV